MRMESEQDRDFRGASFSVDLQWYVGHEDPVTQYRVFLPDSQKHRDIDEMWPALAEYMPVPRPGV